MIRCPRHCLILVVLLIGWAHGVSAQGPLAQVRVVGDGTVLWRADSAIAIATVRAGTTLEVTRQSQRWFEVIVPPSLGGRGERGLIARSQVERLRGGTEPPGASLRGDPPAGQQVSRPAPTRSAVPSGPRIRRAFVSLNGAFQSRTYEFGETVTFRENAEEGRYETAYSVESAPAFAVGGGALVSPRLGIGASLVRLSKSTPTTLTAAIPHPFFFGVPRSIAADLGGLRREELALHGEFRAVWPVAARLHVAAVAGPSIFNVRQEVLADFSYTDAYPYDEARLDTPDIVRVKRSALGFNVGGDATFFITSRIGVGVSASFSRAEVDLPVESGRTATTRVGGLMTGGGVRLRF